MLHVFCFAVLVIAASVSFAFLIYLGAGAWRLYLRIRAIEMKLAIVDLKLMELISTLDHHIALRKTILPRSPD